MPRLPLDGIRILDSTYVFALPYAGGHLADLGAEVIKIEGPGRPDITRTGGYAGSFPENDPGADWWNRPSTYNLLNRGKRSLVLDLSTERGRDLFRELVAVSDVVMENFTPRVMRRWNLDYPNLRQIKPDIILISNTGYGHGDGPYSAYPAQATTQEATHGHCWITGYPDAEPAKAGASFVDFLSTWSAIFALGAALRHRHRTGQGQWIDLAMYQAGVMFMSEYILDAAVNGNDGGRIGNRHPYRAPQGCYPAAGHDQWLTLSVGSPEEWAALCQLLNRPELTDDPRFADLPARQQNHDQLDAIIAQWTADQDKYALMHLLQNAGIPAGPVLTGRDIHFDPHYQSRGFLEPVQFPPERGIGVRPLMGRPYQLASTPLAIRGPGPAFGQDNAPLLQDLLGIDAAAYQELTDSGIIADTPTSGEPSPQMEPARALEMGLLADYDPHYRQRLGIE